MIRKKCSGCGFIFPATENTCPQCGKGFGVPREDEKEPIVSKPKCPTCGSENIERISSVAKATNIVAFGIFGNKRKYQFKCKNCKYMW